MIIGKTISNELGKNQQYPTLDKMEIVHLDIMMKLFREIQPLTIRRLIINLIYQIEYENR